MSHPEVVYFNHNFSSRASELLCKNYPKLLANSTSLRLQHRLIARPTQTHWTNLGQRSFMSSSNMTTGFVSEPALCTQISGPQLAQKAMGSLTASRLHEEPQAHQSTEANTNCRMVASGAVLYPCATSTHRGQHIYENGKI